MINEKKQISSSGTTPLQSTMSNRRLPTVDLFSLKGKTVIATGATGGLGAEMCLSLAEAGANIVALLLPGDKATLALSNLITETGRSFISFECDVSNTSALREVFSKMWSCNIVPDILLNCAGLNRRHPIVDMTDANIDLVSFPRSERYPEMQFTSCINFVNAEQL